MIASLSRINCGSLVMVVLDCLKLEFDFVELGDVVAEFESELVNEDSETVVGVDMPESRYWCWWLNCE